MNRTEHLLACLAEECAEVIQRATKAQRWGLGEIQPDQNRTNAERIVAELQDLHAIMEMLDDEGVIQMGIDRAAVETKKRKVEHFINYARELGILKP